MDSNSWLFGFSQNFLSDMFSRIIAAVAMVVMIWAKSKGLRWVTPVLYGLLAGACTYVLIRGFLSQGGAPLVGLTPPVPLTGLLIVVLLAHALYLHSLLRGVRKELDLTQKRMTRYVLPRSLTAEQKNSIADYLSKYEPSPIVVKIIPRDGEASNYGADFIETLMKGGWPVAGSLDDETAPEGVTVHMESPHPKPRQEDPFDKLRPKKTSAEILCEALTQAGVNVNGPSGTSGIHITTTTITLLVGKRRRDKWAIPPVLQPKNMLPHDPDMGK